MCIKQLEQGHAEVENQYSRVVSQQGNQPAQQLLQQVFKVVDQQWRGLAEIPESGLTISEEYADWNAENRFSVAFPSKLKSQICVVVENY